MSMNVQTIHARIKANARILLEVTYVTVLQDGKDNYAFQV